MRDGFRDWLRAQGYADNTCTARASSVSRVEAAYGALDGLIAEGRFDALLADLTYSTEDERRARPNPSQVPIAGTLRTGLASLKDAAALYRRFVQETAGEPVAEPLAPPEPEDRQRLALERDMQMALRRDLGALEPGLVVADDGAERAVATGFIDILATDAAGARVVIELKAGRADARVIGQTLGYMGDLMADDPRGPVRGIIVAHEFDPRTRAAARAVPNLALYTYAIAFSFRAEG